MKLHVLYMVTCFLSSKRTQNFFRAYSDMCLCNKNPLLFKPFFRVIEFIHVYLIIYSVSEALSCPSVIFQLTLYCLALETKKIVSQKPRVGLMVAVLSFFPFFLPLVKIMKVINFFYLCLSSLKNFIFICDILSEYQWWNDSRMKVWKYEHYEW